MTKHILTPYITPEVRIKVLTHAGKICAGSFFSEEFEVDENYNYGELD